MKNTNNIYQTKNALEIKDFDSENRRVAIYLSKFDTIDSDNDMIKRGAFTKSINEHGVNSPSNRKIQFLRHHDWTKQIGKFIELSEDNVGLFAVGELGHSTIGNDAWNDYMDGIIREHSIGFKYVNDKTKWIDDVTMESKGYWQISEVMLWEGSAVTFGANEFTNVVDVIKSGNASDHVFKISTEIDTLVKSLMHGNRSDERCHEIEMRIKFLNAQLSTLATSNEPIINDHSSIVSMPEINENAFDWQSIHDKIKF